MKQKLFTLFLALTSSVGTMLAQHDAWAEIKFTARVVKTELPADSIFTSDLEGFKAQITDTGDKMAIDSNFVYFGTQEEHYEHYFRLKTGGTTRLNTNFITISVPSDGKLLIAARTGSNDATDHTVVVTQGADTLYDRVVVEADTLPGKIYPFIMVDVKEGDVAVTYPIGSINFYAFKFLSYFKITLNSSPLVAGNTSKIYNDNNTGIISATPNYGYHFLQWNDGNTDNPRTIVLTQDTAFTAEFGATGQCGDSLQWSFADSVLTITGTGDMWNKQPWANLRNSIKQVFFPQEITSIGHSAFYGCTELTSVTIPNSIISIGNSAFYGCTGLTSVTIGNSVTSIGDYAFEDCTGLTSVMLNSYFIVGRTYTSKSNITAIFGKKIKEYILGDSITSVGDCAFYDCESLTSVIIPNSVTSIGRSAFWHCSGLTSVTIGNSVTSIGKSAFCGCTGLTSVTIPNSVTSIGNYAFDECSSLPVVDNLRYADTYLVEAVDKTLSSYTIKDGTKWIGDNAFSECSSLTSVTIPNTLTSIGSHAFYHCSSLTSVEIPNSVTSIGETAFTGCSGLTSVTIPSSVTSIEMGTFSACSGLTSVTIPSSVTSIGIYAFSECSGLTSVTIPNSVTSIGERAFSGCTRLTSVTIGNSVTSIGDYAFRYCTGLTSVHIFDIAAWCRIGFYNNESNPLYHAHNLYVNDELVMDLVIPDNVTSINNYAFYDCSNLTSVTIPNSVTSIGEKAFCNCNRIASVILNSNAITSKTTYTTSANIGSIFGSQVKKYTIGDDVTTIGKDAFYGCSQVTNVYIGANVTSIGNWAFQNCSNLDTLYLGANITSYGQKVFAGCPNISAIYNYRERPAKLGTDAFKDVDYFNSTLYVLAGSVDMYKSSGSDWKDFYFIEPIGAKQTTTEDVVVTPHDNTADIVWPATNGVNFYSLTITDSEGNQICTLTFNANGQLISLAFHAPAYNNAPQQQTEQVAGFQFTITGLDAATRYAYTLLAKDAQDQVIETYSGTFATNGYMAETFTIRFVNWDGTELQSSSVEEGTIPVYNGEEPTHVADDEYTYTFTGWTPELVAATENVTYVATFETHPIATTIDNISTSSAATKIFRDGQIVILRGEKVYTITGQEVR